MAKYTIELRKIQADFYAAMQDYPIFNESYRETLNDKIYHACKYREIGLETPELFCEYLHSWMDVHMPEFNPEYLANEALLKLTPTQRLKIMEVFNGLKKGNENGSTTTDENSERTTNERGTSNTTYNRDNTSQSTDTGNDTSNTTETASGTESGNSNRNSAAYHSDFPQANLTDKDDSNYYTTGDYDNDTETTSGTSSTNSTTNTTDTTNHKNDSHSNESSTTGVGSTSNSQDINKVNSNAQSQKENSETDMHTTERTGNENYTDFELIEMYRKTFVNVDKKIIRALKRDLFMNIW